MSKKTNSLLFMLVATLVNLVLLLLFLIIGFVAMGLIVSYVPSSESLMPLMLILVFGLSVFGSFFIYSRLIRWATVRFSLEDKLDPLFTSKRNVRRRDD